MCTGESSIARLEMILCWGDEEYCAAKLRRMVLMNGSNEVTSLGFKVG